MRQGSHTERRRRVVGGGIAGIASIALLSACGAASRATPTTSETASPLPPAPAGSPSAVATPEPAATAEQLIALAQQVYLTSTHGTCVRGNPSAPSTSDYSNCPFTESLAQRLVAAQQAQLRPFSAGRSVVLCHCQNGPTAYNATDASPSADGGTVKVVAVYCCNNTVTFTLTVVTQHGQLLVNDIVVQAPECGHPEEIDATSC